MNAEIQSHGIGESARKAVESIEIESRGKVLVVDDEREIVDLLVYNLKRQNYEVLTAYSGGEALRQARIGKPDLILLDFMLPEFSGPEVASQLKQGPETADIPIIFLTARNDTESIVEGLGTGATDYVTKPFNFIELKARIETQLKLKDALDRLKETQKDLRKAEVARDKLFTIFVHDIKSPFHSLNGFVERLYRRYDDLSDTERRHTVEVIRQGTSHVQLLLSKLLQWNCLQNGLFQWRPESVNLKSSVNNVVELLSARLVEKEIELAVSVGESVTVFVDRGMLEAVLRNLLQNSLKFTPDGGRVWLRSRRVGNKEEVAVVDNGIGIRAEALKKIFQAEFNQATVDLHGEKSTGLGLILCKEFIELNGGSMGVSSVFGAGSEFTFTLPGLG